MREINRTIVSAIILSKDRKILMGQKDPEKGGVYADSWHIPGGGVEAGETFEKTLIREVREEAGLDIANYPMISIPIIGHGSSEKVIKYTGEKVLCKMEFNRFEVHINDRDADEIELKPGDDLVILKWFSREELANIKHIPGGKEFFQEMGYIK